jgi:RHH-type rel operon transcriptional repressor/antitoxin RelB
MLNRLKDVFESFQKHNVKYIVIGGIAAVLYGIPRATFDLDILIEATQENARHLLDALLDAGLGTASLTNADEILSNEITIFKDRVHIDVQINTLIKKILHSVPITLTMYYIKIHWRWCMSTAISIRLPDRLAEKLSEISEETERPKSFHIQKALEAYLAELADIQIAIDRMHDTSDPVISIKDMRKELEL